MTIIRIGDDSDVVPDDGTQKLLALLVFIILLVKMIIARVAVIIKEGQRREKR